MAFYLNANIIYFELTILPIIISLIYWNKIDNKLFKILLIFSLVYFAILPFQGRAFDRYLQIGIITSASALAFPISYYFTRRYFHVGLIVLFLYVSWNLFVHRSYISALYHHIPYEYIVTQIKK